MRFLWIVLALALYAAAHAEEGERRPPFITTPNDVVDRMLALAGARAGDTVVDLGSGDGRIVIRAAEKFGARGIGIELDENLVAKSRDNARLARVEDRVSFIHGDVLVSDISKASVVTVYLLPSLLDRLQPRFIDELKPGTRIVSHAFAMPGWGPDNSETMRIAGPHSGQGDESTLFLWVVPAEARGEWRGGDWQLHIYQNYQEIDVEAKRAGKSVALKEARLRGSDLEWSGEGVRFRGRVEGGKMVGELVDPSGRQPMSLTRIRSR